ncbi:hypothetical protein [Azospirillum sp. TSO22-1]|uniref:hypothetical protein n=1 Tax=Azospirillum sp. TSO22-1 TaxID=716789 RepID=UPI000D60F723|nr:hypothetical protein [Azospirillum sp. TSO22-1]PWC41755.1 hypothetical protein TSO221_22900 [Azospirillum sp. TSO22-1]
MTNADLRTLGYALPEVPVVPAGPRFLVETLTMPAGPHVGLQNAARDALCSAAVGRGVTPVISATWEDLEALNRANLGSWLPLMRRPDGSDWFWLGAVDERGEVVATQGAALVDCTVASFGDRLSDLSFFSGRRAPGERCFCASPTAFETRGRVAYVTAGWTHPDARGRGLFPLLGRLVRLVAWARWAPSWWVGMVSDAVAPQWSEAKAGRRFLESRPTILYQNPAAGFDYPPYRLLRFCRAGVLLDLQEVSAAGSRTTPNAAA